MKECPRCLLTDNIAGVVIKENRMDNGRLLTPTQCNYCNMADRLESQFPVSNDNFNRDIKRIKALGIGRKYDCLLGISGGFDSSYLAYRLFGAGCRVLLIHYDNGFDTVEATSNVNAVVEKTGFDFINYKMGHAEFKVVSKAFLYAGVSDADIPNDIAMSKLFIETAKKYRIRAVINGHNFRTEGSCPVGWTYMDGKYVRSVAEQAGIQVRNLPLLGAFDQVTGIKAFRLLYHCNVDKEREKIVLSAWCNWKDYGGHHCENIYTEFVGYYLWRRFGIDKRIVEQSAFIRSGKTTKDKARELLRQPISLNPVKKDIVLDSLYMDDKDFDFLLTEPRSVFEDYDTYNKLFRRLKPLIWLGVKFNIFPRTFYEKYTRKVVWPK
jgi:hypothetical protein